VPACQESHCQQILINTYPLAVKVANPWNVPACDETAILIIPDATQALVGSYLWNPIYGYFEITGFNSTTKQLTVINNCNAGNATEGTAVPECALFVVTDEPSESSGPSSTYPYVAIDFTAPANGDCLLITVTNVNGLVTGKNITIGTGTYRISAINSATTITICNDGTGITPGTSVIAKNGAGQYQYPITLVDSNPCTNPEVTTGSVVVCKDDIMQPLTGAAVGSVLVLQDTATGEAKYEALDVPTLSCTALSACLILSAGDATYTLIVIDSSQFQVGDVVTIGSRTEQYLITGIPDSTTIEVTVNPVPTATVNIPPGTSVCLIGCCEEAACAEQAQIVAITAQVFIEDPDFSLSSAFEAELTDNLVEITLPDDCVGATYRVFGFVQVLGLADYSNPAPDLGIMMNEVVLQWSNQANNAGAGRHVWSHTGMEGYDTAGDYPDNVDGLGAWLLIQDGSPNWPMMYSAGGTISQTLASGGDTVSLSAHYHALVGDNFPPTSIGSTRIRLEGIILAVRL
jgi:hypothetical protein